MIIDTQTPGVSKYSFLTFRGDTYLITVISGGSLVPSLRFYENTHFLKTHFASSPLFAAGDHGDE